MKNYRRNMQRKVRIFDVKGKVRGVVEGREKILENSPEQGWKQ